MTVTEYLLEIELGFRRPTPDSGYHGKSGQDLLKDGSDLQNVEARIGVLVGHTSDAESRAFSAIDRLHTRAESFRFAGKWC